ncbi:MAG: hypothetical protein CL474_00080 [Acidobacteria bacterium]|jgi:hypothetical protein|nr:hypothetical protein [Acidobacteriota bacterium]
MVVLFVLEADARAPGRLIQPSLSQVDAFAVGLHQRNRVVFTSGIAGNIGKMIYGPRTYRMGFCVICGGGLAS